MTLGSRQLGRYQLTERIALSGSAEVYLAHPIAGGEPVAIKRLLPHALEDSVIRQAFSLEIERALQNTHPGLVRGLEVVDGPAPPGERGDPCLVMALVEGDPLSALVAGARHHGPPPPPAIAHVASALASSLHALHGLQCVHADVSSRNVVALPSGEFTLLDLGSVREEGAVPGDQGTPRYAAPERERGAPLARHQDIYSLGVLLWELAMAQPWDPNGGGPLFAGQPSLAQSPVGMLIARCVDRDEGSRPQSASELMAAARALAEDTGRGAWRQWLFKVTEREEQPEAFDGRVAWITLLAALGVATWTAGWFIAQML